MWWFVGNWLTVSANAFVLVVMWMSHDHVVIWTNQNLADVLHLSPCINVKLIHVDRSKRKMLILPDLNMGVCDTKSEPIAAQLAILPPQDQCPCAMYTPMHSPFTRLVPSPFPTHTHLCGDTNRKTHFSTVWTVHSLTLHRAWKERVS